MTDADDRDLELIATKQLAYSLRLGLNGTSRSFLDQDVSVLAMLKGKEYQIHSLIKRHDETSHGRLRESDRIPVSFVAQGFFLYHVVVVVNLDKLQILCVHIVIFWQASTSLPP